VQPFYVVVFTFEKLEHAPRGLDILVPFIGFSAPLTDDELVERERFRFGDIEREIFVLHGHIMSKRDVHEMQFLRHDIKVFDGVLLFVGFCSGIGEKLKCQLPMDELGEPAVVVHLSDEAAFTENLVHIYRLGELEPSGNENIRVHGSGCRNLKGVVKVVSVKLLTPTTDKNDVLEDTGILQVFENGIEDFKFSVHGGPF
jgi:hypothetical protein